MVTRSCRRGRTQTCSRRKSEIWSTSARCRFFLLSDHVIAFECELSIVFIAPLRPSLPSTPSPFSLSLSLHNFPTSPRPLFSFPPSLFPLLFLFLQAKLADELRAQVTVLERQLQEQCEETRRLQNLSPTLQGQRQTDDLPLISMEASCAFCAREWWWRFTCKHVCVQ